MIKKWIFLLWLGCLFLFPGFSIANDKVSKDYPSITYSISETEIKIVVDGVDIEDVVDFAWQGENQSNILIEAINNNTAAFIETSDGFEIIVVGSEEELTAIGDGNFEVVVSTGISLSVPIVISTPASNDVTINENKASKSTAKVAACTSPWLYFRNPTSLNPNKNCKYGSQNCYVSGKYHTGVDYSGSGSVYATETGKVVRIEYMSKNDHGMGNNIIIRHTLSNCSYIYSTYSHMESISSAIKVGSNVSKGQKIGTIGGSGYGKPNYWANHLHFEMKYAPVTNNPWGGGPYWGYTPKNPDNYGYRNPYDFIK
jgi:murein DD-endopeptidase MepM/ murein hydrolase activator NlpD